MYLRIIYLYLLDSMIQHNGPYKDDNMQMQVDLQGLSSSWPADEDYANGYPPENANSVKWQVPSIWRSIK